MDRKAELLFAVCRFRKKDGSLYLSQAGDDVWGGGMRDEG
jgi:hypothetical protein